MSASCDYPKLPGDREGNFGISYMAIPENTLLRSESARLQRIQLIMLIMIAWRFSIFATTVNPLEIIEMNQIEKGLKFERNVSIDGEALLP